MKLLVTQYIWNLVKTCWPVLSYFFLFLLILLLSIAVPIINPISASYIDLHVSRINLGKCGAALISRCSGISGPSMTWSSCECDSIFATLLTSSTLRFTKSPFQLRQFSVSEMLSGGHCSSLSARWWLILLIRRTLNTWVCPPGWSGGAKAAGNGDFSRNSNSATPSCCKFD